MVCPRFILKMNDMRPIRTTHIGFSLSRLHGMNVAIKWTGTCYNIKKRPNVRTQLIESYA